MELQEIKGKVMPFLEKILTKTRTSEQSEELSNEFIIVRSLLADEYEAAERLAGALEAEKKATYAQAVFASGEKTAGLKEYDADRNESVVQIRAAVAEANSRMNWLENHLKIFNDATVGFRQKADRQGRT
jgi:hypothetical protein